MKWLSSFTLVPLVDPGQGLLALEHACHLVGGLPLQKRRLLLCLLIITTFLTGAVLGAILFAHLRYFALAVPAGVTGVAGLVYMLWRHLAPQPST